MNDPSPFVIANLKANLTWDEVSSWIDVVGTKAENFKGTIVLAPSFPFLQSASEKIKKDNLNIRLAAQDVSKFEMGAYTGEVSASQLEGICQYCVVGHSERRKYFREDDGDVLKKTELLLKYNIDPILCISDTSQLESYMKDTNTLKENSPKIIFVNEPPSAISGGGDYKPEDPKTVNDGAAKIQSLVGDKIVTIYGGSINPDNAKSFFQEENINGGLVGQASLDPLTFTKILELVN